MMKIPSLAVVLYLCGAVIIPGLEAHLPTGHHEPFGGHRPADVPIDETDIAPDPKTFWNDYVSQGRPLIVRGGMTHSPAFKLWNAEYLKEKYGDLEVRLEGKEEKGFGSPIPVGDKGLGRDTLKNFVDTYKKANKYIVSQLPDPMYEEVMVPPSMQCGSLKESLVEIDLWMSSGNSKSVLHKDAFNTWNCLLSGTKIWKMVENKYEKLIYKAWEPERAIGGYSLINTTKVDLLSQPLVQRVRWSNLTINAGDCLFLPRSYYHQVTSFGDPNVAVALLFSRLTEFDDTGCEDAVLDYTPLSDMVVTWNWTGHGNMTMGHMDHVGIRDHLQKIIQVVGKFTAQHIIAELKINDPEMPLEEITKHAEQAFDILDKDKKGYLTEDDAKTIDVETLRKFILAFESQEPSNTEFFEYYHINLDIIDDMTRQLLTHFDSVTKTTFVKHYTHDLGGSEEKALEIFNKLSAGKDYFTETDYMDQFETAMENWRMWSETEVMDPVIQNREIYDEVAPQRDELLLFRDDLQFELKDTQEEFLKELIREEKDEKIKFLLTEAFETNFYEYEDFGLKDEL